MDHRDLHITLTSDLKVKKLNIGNSRIQAVTFYILIWTYDIWYVGEYHKMACHVLSRPSCDLYLRSQGQIIDFMGIFVSWL